MGEARKQECWESRKIREVTTQSEKSGMPNHQWRAGKEDLWGGKLTSVWPRLRRDVVRPLVWASGHMCSQGKLVGGRARYRVEENKHQQRWLAYL